MHGVLWAHCAHGTHRPVFSFGAVPEGGKTGVFIIVRSVSAGGYSRSQEAAGVTPWGFPNQFENE